MTLATALAALVSSVVLVFSGQARVAAIVALAASALEALIALRIVHLHVAGLPLGVLLGAALLVAGALVYLKVGTKSAVTAATVAVLVGAFQVLRGLHFM